MCTFRFHFWTGKSIEIRPSHVRASSVPNLCAFCLNKRSCIFVRTGRPLLLILRFCGLIFGTARRSQKWDRENAFLCSFTKLCMRSQKWDRQIFGTVFRFIFVKFFASGLKKRKRIFVAYGDRKGNCTCCHDKFSGKVFGKRNLGNANQETLVLPNLKFWFCGFWNAQCDAEAVRNRSRVTSLQLCSLMFLKSIF